MPISKYFFVPLWHGTKDILSKFCWYISWPKKGLADILFPNKYSFNWVPIRAIIEVAYTKGYNSTGRLGYDSLVLFKIELLHTWYGLSDVEVEDQVNDLLSFSRFAGLGMEDTVPDSTTVCRFRNVLVEADLYDTLLDEFNRQLEVKGVIVKHGAIVDASITPPVVPADVRAMKSLRIEKFRKLLEMAERYRRKNQYV